MTEGSRAPAVAVYTVAEAAKTLKMSEQTLYRLIRGGKVPHRKIKGVGLRFTPEDIREILDEAHRPAVA